MVADAVQVEPVSTPEFPANREINREFRRIRLLGAILKADMPANSDACGKIPYSTQQNREFLRGNREFVRENREFERCKVIFG
jgi:hypothetical protein